MDLGHVRLSEMAIAVLSGVDLRWQSNAGCNHEE